MHPVDARRISMAAVFGGSIILTGVLVYGGGTLWNSVA